METAVGRRIQSVLSFFPYHFSASSLTRSGWVLEMSFRLFATLLHIFAKTMVRQQRSPFEVALDVPNAETLTAIDDVNHGRNLSKSFHSVTELMEDLNA